MTDLDMWSAIVGFASPPLIAFLVQSKWAPWAKALTALVVCVIGGGVTAYLTGYLHGMSPARAVLVTLFSALAFYRMFWHPSKIAPAIERFTDLSQDDNTGTGAHRPPPRLSVPAPAPPRQMDTRPGTWPN
jgi:hypothetical protein